MSRALARRGRFAVHAVVGPHHGGDLALLDERAERGEVGLEQVALGGPGVEMVAVRLGAAVDREVLGGGDDAVVPGIVALQALHEGDAQAGRQMGILAVGLLSAPPARVAEDVDVRGTRTSGPGSGRAFPWRTNWWCLARASFPMTVAVSWRERLVEGGGEPDGLGEDGGDAGAGHAVETLVPPVVGGDPQARDGGRIVRELRDLLCGAHPRDEVPGSRLEVERQVLVGGVGGPVGRGGLGRDRSRHQGQPGDDGRRQGSAKKDMHEPRTIVDGAGEIKKRRPSMPIG